MENKEVINEVRIPAEGVLLQGDLNVPAGAKGIVVFAHGSGSSRQSPRNQYVASVFRHAGLGTLLFDLLTPEEESVDVYTRQFRFDIGLLSKRLSAACKWLSGFDGCQGLSIGLFGASTGGAAALVAAAELDGLVGGVVSRGGRPDLAGEALSRVRSPVLLIVGGFDDVVIRLNEEAFAQLACEKMMKVVPGATHLFSEPGKLEKVAELAAVWFKIHLAPAAAPAKRYYAETV